MSGTYSSGAWAAKEGEGEAFVEAWTEFAHSLSTMPGAGTARLTRDLSEPRALSELRSLGERGRAARVEVHP